MIVENKIQKVWLIKDNKLVNENKIVSKINYNGMEIAVLSAERDDRNRQEILIKDNDNEYWKLNLVEVDFEKIINAKLDSSIIECKIYSDNVVNEISQIDLETFFKDKIDKQKYFNMCELAYISKNYPKMFEQAKECREKIIERNRKISQEQEQKEEQSRKQEVKEVNTEFKKQLKEIKKKICNGRIIQIFDLEFYKDDKYENGKTRQNCILYLAKQYGINIPLATQGFINNRLTAYHFEKRISYFRETSNKRCSTAMGKYLDQIYENVKKEYKKQKICER